MNILLRKYLRHGGARKAYQLQFIDIDKDELVGGVIMTKQPKLIAL